MQHDVAHVGQPPSGVEHLVDAHNPRGEWVQVRELVVAGPGDGELAARASSNPQLRLAINADKAAPFGQIVLVMDAAKAAGIKMVNAFTKQAAQ